jgi:hypothetical protein
MAVFFCEDGNEPLGSIKHENVENFLISSATLGGSRTTLLHEVT